MSEGSKIRYRAHKGLILDVSSEGFDKSSASFGSLFADDENAGNLFLFYSGAQDVPWSQCAIGLAVSKDGLEFRKISKDPVLTCPRGSFCIREAVAPAVTRIGNNYYMIFSGRSSPKASRRIGIAYADDPKGPWHVIGEILKPTCLWEGSHIDNGPTIVKLEETSFLVFYSSVTTPHKFDIFARLRGYPIRRIGVAKVRVRGPSLSQIEVNKLSANPLKHLNGGKGSWRESVFCPGYLELNDVHYLIPATSTYSIGFPYEQHIGITSSNAPFFNESKIRIDKLIDGPSEKSQIIPGIESQIALDSPSPLLRKEENKLYLYYSVADRADYIWKMALTTFDLTDSRMPSQSSSFNSTCAESKT